jgi:hypothetical protein
METNLLSAEPNPEEQKPQCTLVFDREAYEPAFFHRLWETYKIAVITYRKNVKDTWEENCFNTTDVQVLDNAVNMEICERKTELGGYTFREIRKLGVGGHQTAIITTNPDLETKKVAGNMFARWSQENFFRYLIQDYDFDKMVCFGVETIDPDKMVVNPLYRQITHKLKKLREKKQRIEAKFYPLAEQVIDDPLDNLPILTNKQMEYKLLIEQYASEEKQLLEERKKHPPKIKLRLMPEQKRYNKLKVESKMLMNVIKMICYRAESSIASLLSPYLLKAEKEKRMVVKQIIKANADITPDYLSNTLTINLYSLSAKRYNYAASILAELLNETETNFPGTNLKMKFKISANSNCER